jgi:hypothetical protein
MVYLACMIDVSICNQYSMLWIVERKENGEDRGEKGEIFIVLLGLAFCLSRPRKKHAPFAADSSFVLISANFSLGFRPRNTAQKRLPIPIGSPSDPHRYLPPWYDHTDSLDTMPSYVYYVQRPPINHSGYGMTTFTTLAAMKGRKTPDKH